MGPLMFSTNPTIFAGMDRWKCPEEKIMQSLFDWTNLWWTGFYLGPNYNFMDKYPMLRRIGWGILPIYWGRQPLGYCSAVKENLPPKRAARFDVQICRGKEELHGSESDAFDLGVRHGADAALLAARAQIPRGSIVYLDCEIPHSDKRWFTYFAGWVRGLVSGWYRPGCYCSFFQSFPDRLLSNFSQRPNKLLWEKELPVIWAMKRTTLKANFTAPFPETHPGGGSPRATVWQHAHNANLKWKDNTDPSKPRDMLLPVVDLNTSLVRDPSQGEISNVSVLKKKYQQQSRLKPEYVHSGELKPALQQSGQLK